MSWTLIWYSRTAEYMGHGQIWPLSNPCRTSFLTITMLPFLMTLELPYCRECVSLDAAGAWTCRSLGHHLLHPMILMLLVLSVLFCRTDCNRRSKFLTDALIYYLGSSKNEHPSLLITELIKVSKSRKQFMVSSILKKKNVGIILCTENFESNFLCPQFSQKTNVRF